MADGDKITLVIEGLPEDEGRLRFAAFLNELQNLSLTIARLDRDANNGKPASYFRITELSYGSPARVVLEPHPIGREPYTGRLIVESLDRVRDAFVNGSDLAELDAELLEDIGKLARPVGKNVKSAIILFDDKQLDLTDTVTQRVDQALAVVEECAGTFQGMLEQINIHLAANVFHIFPDAGPKKITCHFPQRLYDDAVSAIGRRVEVSGVLRYRARAAFPHEIQVVQIEVFPPKSELPDWEDLRGRAPDATGALPSEEFVRGLRDGWG